MVETDFDVPRVKPYCVELAVPLTTHCGPTNGFPLQSSRLLLSRRHHWLSIAFSCGARDSFSHSTTTGWEGVTSQLIQLDLRLQTNLPTSPHASIFRTDLVGVTTSPAENVREQKVLRTSYMSRSRISNLLDRQLTRKKLPTNQKIFSRSL